MKLLFLILHSVVSVLLVTFVLLQSSQGGLGSAFGGGEFYRTKRGAERVIFTATIVTAVAFFITSIVNLIAR
ncbi:preprotein translocase subunit SecG [Candidatus Gottesmanbacteria bacterium RIFCSPLOWO2_01_FULL_49_10]|uniref:Protein-export membrane protein SecG n=1 Tax=Candidatus Gottesmanbacteria bacterium RIFCSPLOWO2_01_FULL_49_10 TaxID=1798396 RepID=A0A1F6AYP5_9BACT|nr:MAG: preprotein translocase subunit SecG [Candidatus Gottesmanbacteria bacterium RIFCSPLOWO2_01_FULL_49_10]